MSIHEKLAMLEERGELVAFLPPPGWPLRRSLFLTAHLLGEIRSGQSSLHFFGQTVGIRVMFGHWTSVGAMTVRLGGRRGSAELARLDPPPEDIWEFRVTRHLPQVRVFGRFAAPDIFVATAAIDRQRLGSASTRKSRQGKMWSEAMCGCLSEWNRLFGGYPAFQGRRARDYVSENCFGQEQSL